MGEVKMGEGSLFQDIAIVATTSLFLTQVRVVENVNNHSDTPSTGVRATLPKKKQRS
jgi:hypothetical protein